jgi:hypothetical protein
MTQGFGEAVGKFSSEVDAAVSRARRAAAEAREQNTGLRASLSADDAEKPAEVPPSGDDDDDFSQEQIMTRF